jgi:hypothetical protein
MTDIPNKFCDAPVFDQNVGSWDVSPVNYMYNVALM